MDERRRPPRPIPKPKPRNKGPIEIVGDPVQGEPAEPKPPIEFEDLGGDVYEVGGTRFSGDFFRNFVVPDPEETFRFRRTPDGVVWIDRVSSGSPPGAGG